MQFSNDYFIVYSWQRVNRMMTFALIYCPYNNMP